MGNNSQMISLLYIVGLFAILYFLMIRPQQQRQKKHQEMMKNLKPDDNVITIGGIYGKTVVIVDDIIDRAKNIEELKVCHERSIAGVERFFLEEEYSLHPIHPSCNEM